MADKSRYAAQTQGTWLALPEYSYDQHYTEQIGAAYASLEYSAGRWELSAGLRGEYTSVASQAFGRSYFGLFPNVSVSRALNALRTWLLVAQWSRNIERPAFPALNPARIRISDYSWQSGNPSLRPTYIHRFSLTAVWKYRYTLTVGGNHEPVVLCVMVFGTDIHGVRGGCVPVCDFANQVVVRTDPHIGLQLAIGQPLAAADLHTPFFAHGR